jgi:hypothetical protein
MRITLLPLLLSLPHGTHHPLHVAPVRAALGPRVDARLLPRLIRVQDVAAPDADRRDPGMPRAGLRPGRERGRQPEDRDPLEPQGAAASARSAPAPK